jgi:hypothetical protein
VDRRNAKFTELLDEVNIRTFDIADDYWSHEIALRLKVTAQVHLKVAPFAHPDRLRNEGILRTILKQSACALPQEGLLRNTYLVFVST